MTTATSPFPTIHAALHGVPSRRRGWYDATCPNCGKEAVRGQTHFGYSEEGQSHCFVCGFSGGLNKLADLLRVEIGEYIPPAATPKPEPAIARWRQNPSRLLAQYRNHPRRYELWEKYKPLSKESIDKWDLGVGRLPFQRDNGEWYLSRSDWLTVPLWDSGQLVAIRGRNMGSDGPKWLSSRGSEYALAFVDNVQAGSACWVVENVVDAIWLMDMRPEWSAVSTNGATTWRPDWAAQLAGRKPALVVVALDCDLPGNGGGHLREQLCAEWRATHPQAAIPEANGPKIANSLRRAGVDARLFEWPDTAPAKAGIDWILMK